MLDLARPDPERERAERTVGGSMTVAAHDSGAGQREALFRPHDVDDPLLGGERVDIRHAELGDVGAQCAELLRALGVRDRQLAPLGIDARSGRQIVVGHCQRQVGPAHAAPCAAQPLERLRAGDFVDEVTVDVDQAGAVVATLHDMGVPNLLVQGARLV